MTKHARTILITGCAGGIGLATARHFAAAGDTVVATVRSLDRAGTLRAALDAVDTPTDVLELDVTDDAATDIVAGVIDRHDGIDVLVNNAGVAVEGTLEDLSMADLERSLAVNFLGTARVTKAVLPAMREAGAGRILAVSSVSGVAGMPFQEPYSAAKFALEGLFECTAPVAAMFGVHLTLVEPGPVSGDFITNPNAIVAGPSAPYRHMYDAFVAMRSAAYETCPTPADIAELLFDISHRPDPPLRVQDTEASAAMVANKLADTDGSRTMRTRALFATQ